MSFGEFTTNFHSLPEEVARKLDLWFQWDKVSNLHLYLRVLTIFIE